MHTLNEFYNVFVIQADNIKLINALHFISLLCNINLPKYAYLGIWIYSVASALLFYYCCRGLVRNLNPGGLYKIYLSLFLSVLCNLQILSGGGTVLPNGG